MNQRWLDRRCGDAPGEIFRPSIHEVVETDSDTVVRQFVERHHYSGTLPAARFRFLLLERGELVGAAVFSHPARDEVLTNVFPQLPVLRSVELGRFVLLDRVAANGETWFLQRAFDQLRGRIAGVVSFSDPQPRTAIDGRVVMPGHVGRIYQALNARYLGRGRRDKLRLLPDGRVLARRSYQKIRDGVRGWYPQAEKLIGLGASPIAIDADEPARRAWLATWLPRLTRELAHRGNHRYAWVVDRRFRAHVPEMYGPHRARPKEID